MSPRARRPAPGAALRRLALGVALILGAPALAGAQGTAEVRVTVPTEVPFPAAPEIRVQVIAEPTVPRPLTVQLEVSDQPTFSRVVYSDQVIGESVTFRVVRLLPENANIYLRVRLVDGAGRIVSQQLFGPYATGPRLVLRRPVGSTGVVLFTPFPTFVWSAARIATPPGPWAFDLRVTNVATGKDEVVALGLIDTTFTPVVGLQGNTAYRWSLVGRPVNGDPADAVTLVAPSTFVLSTSGAPVATLVYQNFPNPFPTSFSESTCIWFDLKERARVQLTIHTLRGDRVRTLVPAPGLSGVLDAGAYGRVGDGPNAGCDRRLEWDGRADDGRELPPGVYLLLFRAGNAETVKKIVYRGR
ncbi:MAG TPA: hypothetical protein VGD77_09220 [Gemmatimonadaceae bacterium]